MQEICQFKAEAFRLRGGYLFVRNCTYIASAAFCENMIVDIGLIKEYNYNISFRRTFTEDRRNAQ